MDIKTQLDRKADQIASATVVAKAIIDGRQKEKAMPGDKFFALMDEMTLSQERLDALAEPLLERLAPLEERARRVVEAKHATISAQEDYLDRLEGKVKKAEDATAKATNGGPTVQGSADSPKPSSEPAVPGSSLTPSSNNG